MLAPTVAARLRAELGRELELRFEVGEVPPPPELPRPGPSAASSGRRRGGFAACVRRRLGRASREPRAGNRAHAAGLICDASGPVWRGGSDPRLWYTSCSPFSAYSSGFRLTESGYDSKDITVLEGLEAVRMRPGMYIGSTGPRGLHHLVYEVVDNSVDEALQGRCDHVRAVLSPDGRVTVEDNGSGIPVGVMPEYGLPAAEVVMTKLHAGGKFGGPGYKVSGGLHGVGISVVNALSESLELEVRRDGHVWRQHYERGEPKTPLEKGEADAESGTTITFLPDGDIFEETDFNFETLSPAAARDGVPEPRPADRADRRAGRGRAGRLQVRRRHRRLHRLREREQGHGAQGRHLLRQPDRRRRGRGGDAVERLLRRVDLLVREQHQHARGRHAPLRVQGRADAHPERLRARERPAQGEGGGARPATTAARASRPSSR